MELYHRVRWPRGRNRPGFSLVESVVSTLLVGTLLVAALQSAGTALKNQSRASENVTAAFLANGLMWEILALNYMEPGLKSSTIARESPEMNTSRENYDDVDDYHTWVDSPPQSKNGMELSEYAGWQRSVSVVWVNPDDIQKVSAVETGVKQITVTVSRNANVLATRIALKTDVP